jgi:hypothetical protein
MDLTHNRFTASDLAVLILSTASAAGAVYCVLSALWSL